MIEREVKLSAATGFRVPTLDDAVAGLHCGDGVEHRFDATYFDAADIRLGRMGITLRHRSGEGGPRGRWTLKVPVDPDATGPVIARHEIIKDAASQQVPSDLLKVVRAVLRGAELLPVAHLRTTRRLVPLLVGDVHIGDVCDDAVTVVEGARVRARFRELEVEVTADAPDYLLDATVSRLREAGASDPAAMTKLARAAGPRAHIPPDPLVPIVDPNSRTDVAVQAALAADVHRLIAFVPLVFVDPTVEVVHQARVATRRLRSHLRTFEVLLEPAPAKSLSDELRWLAEPLGNVRDHDVFLNRLTGYHGFVDPVDQDALAGLIARFAERRAPALAELQRALSSKRAATLLDAAVAFSIQPPLTADADRSAAQTFSALARTAFDRLDRRARKLNDDSPIETLHELRIIAKRARYATDSAVAAVPEASEQAKALARLQEVLGDLHDTSIVEHALRAEMPDMTLDEAFVTGLIVAAERHAASIFRTDWQQPWRRARRRRTRAWLHPR